MGSSKKVVVGYRYYMGVHFAVCYGPVDSLQKILVGERLAWSGDKNVSGTIGISAPQLFGGDSREGGVTGAAAVLMGEGTQGPNPYLQSQLGADIPSYRGIFSLLFNGPSSGSTFTIQGQTVTFKNGYITANNPYVKPWAFRVKRILKGWACSGTQPGDVVTEYSNSVFYPWDLTSSDPRTCSNDFEYAASESNLGGGSQPWRATLDEALDDLDVLVDTYRPDLGSPDDPPYNTSSVPRDSIYGWSRLQDNVDVYPWRAYGDHDYEIIRLNFNRQAPDVVYTTPFEGDTDDALNSIGADVGKNYWMQFEGGTTSGVVQRWGEDPGQFYKVNDVFIKVRRKTRAPDNPCSPRCDESYPPDPNNPGFCLIGGASVSQAAWTPVSGTFKALSLHNTLVVTASLTIVDRYPLGPVLPNTDPNYSSQAYWDAAYAAAVTSGDLPSGMTYSPTGTGSASTYPRVTSSAYERSYSEGSTSGDSWYPAKADIDGDMNPAHIVYQCLTDPNWGMGYPVQSVDDANFSAAADLLYIEGFGLSIIWNQQAQIGEFVQQVLDHVAGVLYVDPTTGKFKLKLVRNDYDPNALEVYDTTNIVELESFQRVGYGDTVNEITVVYRDRESNKDTPVTVQNLANIQAQGGVVSKTQQYPGISKADLAARAAMRDLIATSTTLAKCRIKVNRAAWSKVPGDVIKIDWPKLGLSGVIFRVLAINTGSLADGTITVDLAEDMFGLPDSVYIAQEPAGWTEPSNAPAPITVQDVIEAPYWTIARTFDAGDLAVVDADAGYVRALAGRTNGLWQNYRVYSKVGAAEYEERGVGAFASSAVLAAAIGRYETVLDFEDGVDLDAVEVGALAMIGTGDDAEFVEITAISISNSTITVARGVLDTTPQEHADGARIWFTDDSLGEDSTEHATGEAVDVKLATIATGGELDINLATPMQITMAQRFYRPYPPGNLLINGSVEPDPIESTITVTWAHRDRLQQTAYLIHQDEASIGPEAGTTYNAYAFDNDTDELIDTDTGLGGTSWTPVIDQPRSIRIEVEAQRDGVVSWHRNIGFFQYTGTGGLLTEGGESIMTESGDFISTE